MSFTSTTLNHLATTVLFSLWHSYIGAIDGHGPDGQADDVELHHAGRHAEPSLRDDSDNTQVRVPLTPLTMHPFRGIKHSVRQKG